MCGDSWMTLFDLVEARKGCSLFLRIPTQAPGATVKGKGPLPRHLRSKFRESRTNMM